MKPFVYAFTLLALAPVARPVFAQDPMAALPPAPSTSFDWKLKLDPGQKWVQSITTKVKTTQLIMPTKAPQQRVVVQTNQKLDMDGEVVSSDSNGFIIRLTYRNLDVQSDISVNGARTQATQQVQTALKPLYDALDGAAFTLTENTKGKVLEVNGLDNFTARWKAGLAAVVSKGGKNSARALENAALSPTTLADLIKRTATIALPGTPLEIGRGYSYAIDTPEQLPVKMDIYGTRVLKALDGETATFDESATYRTDPMEKMQLTPNPKAALQTDLSGTMSGTTRVDVATGLLSHTRLNQRLTGFTTVSSNKPEQAAKIQLWIATDTEMVLEKK